MPGIHIVIVAAGKGNRFGSDLPKQFCLLGNRPVLFHTISNLQKAIPSGEIVLVLNKQFIELWNGLCSEYGIVSPPIVFGGETRWESVKNAIEGLQLADNDIVMVHDGARPIIDPKMIDRIINALKINSAVVPGLPLSDSIRKIDENGLSATIDRKALVAVQTPQAFNAEKIRKAYNLPYSPLFTDDASVYEAAGFGNVNIVEGSPLNIKITHPHDIEIASVYLKANDGE